MTLQEFFYLTGSIYSIVAVLALVLIAVLALMFFMKLSKIERSLQEIVERGKMAADSAKNIMESGEKLFMLGIYKILKRFGRRSEDDY